MNKFYLSIKSIFVIIFSTIFMQEHEGYTLFSVTSHLDATNGIARTLLIDNDFNVINNWEHENQPASMPYLFQDGSIVYPYTVDSPTMIDGGVGGGIQKISWNGDVLWNYTFSDSIYQHHHDIEPLPNGNVLILVWEKKSIQEAYSKGRIDIEQWSSNSMWSTAILELNPLTGTIDWEWHLWDHLVQDVDPAYGARYGVISEHPELFDINCGTVGNGGGGPQNPNGDWMHINAIDYNPELDQIVMSSKLQNEIYIIDHSTTTEEASSQYGGNSGKGGSILYRWGNPENYDRGESIDKILSAPHGVNWIPSGYPGSGNILVFNNFHDN